MRIRHCIAAAASAVLVVVLAQTARAADANVHEGLVVRAGDGKLTMTDMKGANEHTHVIGPTVRILCDGEVCKLADIKMGYFVRVTTIDGTTVMEIAANKKPPRQDFRGN